MDKESKIYVAGHKGLVGSAISKNLESKGYDNLIFKTHSEMDLTNSLAVSEFFQRERPEYVILAAAKVGGIVANNDYRGQFIYENLMIQSNVIHQSYLSGVRKLLFLGSTCIYPKDAPQPITEDCLLTSPLEYTNEPYAIAKIAGLKMCESYNIQYGTSFVAAMPTNLYGPNDNFDLEKSHVLPALMRKMHCGKLLDDGRHDDLVKNTGTRSMEEAIAYLEKFGVRENRVEIWGSGKPMREFLWSEDMADACVFLMESTRVGEIDSRGCRSSGGYASSSGAKQEARNAHINIGTGVEISIKDLAELIKATVGFRGELYFNTSRPDGTMRKLTDVSRLHALGWRHSVELRDGVRTLYEWYTGRGG